jgi:hypothetical protein
MKIIPCFVRWRFAGKAIAKIPEPPVLKNSVSPPQKTEPKTECISFANDDSPPGYKIRWHF